MKQYRENKVRIRLMSYSHKDVDRSAMSIREAIMGCALVRGPIPFPVRKKKVTIKRSPHIYKKCQQQFERRTCSRLLVLSDVTDTSLKRLEELSLPAGVDVEILVGDGRSSSQAKTHGAADEKKGTES